MARLALEQRPLAVDAPAIAGQASRRSRTTRWQGMATASGVGGAGRGRPRGRTSAGRCAGDLGVAAVVPGGMAAQGLPDPPLEGGAADVEGELAAERRRSTKRDDPGHEPLEFSSPPISRACGKRSWRSRASSSGSSPSRMAQTPRRRRRRGSHRATFADREADGRAVASGPEGGGRHAENSFAVA